MSSASGNKNNSSVWKEARSEAFLNRTADVGCTCWCNCSRMPAAANSGSACFAIPLLWHWPHSWNMAVYLLAVMANSRQERGQTFSSSWDFGYFFPLKGPPEDFCEVHWLELVPPLTKRLIKMQIFNLEALISTFKKNCFKWVWCDLILNIF